MCCSGRECGCMGMPVDPIVCSKECYNKLTNKAMNKGELKTLIRLVATKYGDRVYCELLAHDGYEWIEIKMKIDAHFITELEKGYIRNIRL